MKHILTAAALSILPTLTAAEQVGSVDVDWLGNDIIIEALKDPDVEGVTCHVT